MKSQFLILLCFILGSFVFNSCEKLLMDHDPEPDPEIIFDELWNTIDQKYSFFEYKNIDWDSLYTVYHSRIRERMTPFELFNVLADMMFELEDGHVNLSTSFNLSRNWTWYENFPDNFSTSIMVRNYLGQDYKISGPLRSQIIDSVGYVYYGSFGSNVSAANIDHVIDYLSDTKGIIFDVRHNSGGNLSNANLIISRFADRKRITGYRKYKKGPRHNDFSEPVPIYSEPAGPRQFTEKPVIILTNRRSYSAANHFIMQMRTFPHIQSMGDSSGGGGGTPIHAELPNGWIYRFSSNITLDADQRNVERGIAPDFQVAMTRQDIILGRDSIIDQALEYIKAQH